MSASDETLALLRSIDASLKTLVKVLGATAAKAVASDRDLDGKYGNPKVTFMPRDWAGPSYKGRLFSECPPDLLDMLAETFEYFASQAEAKDERTDRGKPVAEFKRADAARARGWAQRIRSGKHQIATPDTTTESGSDFSSNDEGWSTGPERW